MVQRKSGSRARRALVVSGGAPNATLAAGALTAFIELGLHFDVVTTAGAGALLGLMYCAPKNGDPVGTLAGLKEMGIADPLYEAFPVNYKVFNKPGALADLYRRALGLNPFVQAMMDWPAANSCMQLMKDMTELALATACPSDLNATSLGLCAHVPFAENVIDFSAIAAMEPAFYVNAYDLRAGKMKDFTKREITPVHLQAALSFPFLYPPTELDGGLFIEGAAVDCLNFASLLRRHDDIEEIVVLDILGAERLLRAPRDLYDAWVMSIITPLVEIARDDMKLFRARYMQLHPGVKALHPVPLVDAVEEKDLPDVFDWSRSNLERLFVIGHDSAVRYVEAQRKKGALVD